jgi:alpha-glucosidase
MKWWNNAVIYQVYLRSFNYNINGITEKIPYLKNILNINAIWINPFYPDGGKDAGYDVTDYYNINPLLGTLNNFSTMAKKMKESGIKVIIDLPLNHTSISHPWFIDSIKSKNNKQDWYIWKKKNELPLNWKSEFENSPWTYHPIKKQYYYHYFYKEQPDLNLNNPSVQNEIFNIIKFWCDMGVNGIRLDAVSNYIPCSLFKDNIDSSYNLERQLNTNETMNFIKKIRLHTNSKIKDFVKEELSEDILLIGEQNPYFSKTSDEIILLKYLDKLMNFQFAYLNSIDAEKFKYNLENPKDNMICFLNNHDVIRNRYGEENPEIAKIMATFLLSQNETKIIYYGQEIGMFNGNDYNIDKIGRDVARSPMQWYNTSNTSKYKLDKNWLPLDDNYKYRNVEDQLKNKNSILHWYCNMIQISKELEGKIYEIKLENNILSYNRKKKDNKEYSFILNLSNSKKYLPSISNYINPYQIIILLDKTIMFKSI